MPDPLGCDVARKATWQSHADPRECLRGADVTRVHIYILYIYIILRVIVHISIPYSELANPLFSSHLINTSLSLNFHRVELCSTFVFKCRWRGLTRGIGSRARRMMRVGRVN